MESNKKDYLDVYVNASLNEIKNEVKKEINLQEKRMIETDETMKKILEDLVNDNFKNIKKDSQGDLIYTLLPLSDEQEHKKIRDTLALMYTAIYFHNVTLLKKLQSSGIDLIYYDNLSRKLDRLALSLLDNTITSYFTEDEYVEIVKKHKSVFKEFYQTVIKSENEDKNNYLERFIKILKEIKTPLNDLGVNSLFTKNTMSIYENDTYLKANKPQLKFLSTYFFDSQSNLSPENKKRLNNLIQTKNFASHCEDYEIIFKLFTDEEILKINNLYAVSWYFHQFAESEELLNKAYDLYQKYPDIVRVSSWELNFNLIKVIDNDILIEMLKDELNLDHTPEEMKKLLIVYKPKMLLKKIFRNKNEKIK